MNSQWKLEKLEYWNVPGLVHIILSGQELFTPNSWNGVSPIDFQILENRVRQIISNNSIKWKQVQNQKAQDSVKIQEAA